jgi:translation initiation factor 2 subunit 2
LGDFSDMKKKKKSKKAAFDLEAFEKELEDASKPAAADGDDEDAEDGPPPAIDYDEEDLGDDVFATPSAGAGGELTAAGDAIETWHGSDRDYTYAEVRSLAAAHTMAMPDFTALPR